jgi:hypothetical protein
MEMIRAMSRERLEHGLGPLTRQDRPPFFARCLEAGAPDLAGRIAGDVGRFFAIAIGPHWTQISRDIEADRRRQLQTLGAHGVERLLDTLHPSVRWRQGDETVFGGVRPVTGRWSHLAAVFDPADRRVCLYVNATMEACRTRTTITRAIGAMDIGRAMAEGETVDGWHGAVDDVRVFAGVLDLPQIREVAGHRA